MNNRSIILKGLEEPASVEVLGMGGSPPGPGGAVSATVGSVDAVDAGEEPGSGWYRGAFQPDYPGAWTRGGLNE